MLNEIITITKNKYNSSIYMDWWETSGYMIELVKQEDYFIAHHISSLHIPNSLIELGEFKNTLKYLFKWFYHLKKNKQRN